MSTLFDYLDWRGDLSFSASPFCDVDNLILSELSFLDFSGIVPEHFCDGISLEQAAERYFSTDREGKSASMGLLIPDAIIPFFRRMAECERFRTTTLCGYRTRLDRDREAQFAALTVLLGDGTLFVSYRGTDDTLVGWKEDFNMTFLHTIPAQKEAVKYLDAIAEASSEAIRIGGHSKGGNLAVYAAASATRETQRRILKVYSNDGPGFSREFLDSLGYAAVRDRIQTIVPESSIVGMLLEHEEDYTVVKSRQNGLFQHDGFSWEVKGRDFVCVEDRSAGSKLVDRTLKGLIASLSEEERMDFVESMYTILSAKNAQTLSELGADPGALLQGLRNMTPGQKELLQKVVALLIREWRKNLQMNRAERIKKKKET